MSSAGADADDGPPPYRVEARDRFDAGRERDHPEWVELEVTLRISGLFWDGEPSASETAYCMVDCRRSV
jgi:hypothetical protein